MWHNVNVLRTTPGNIAIIWLDPPSLPYPRLRNLCTTPYVPLVCQKTHLTQNICILESRSTTFHFKR